MAIQINKIVIHCSATRNGKSFARNGLTAAQVIDSWHKQRGFKRTEANRKDFNPNLGSIGYHYVIDVDGTLLTGRKVGETGAHVKGHNLNSIGICLVGGITADGKPHGEYTEQQWGVLYSLLTDLEQRFPHAKLYGHRDLSPDLNSDGTITPNEWVKTCPCFDVWAWLDSEEIINVDHLFKE
ncbi:N-acetylmuramoyl-L-alanine amidase [Lonepinella koalarum]|uniref:N-acetylmuramoyl-L-alanine amidase n=1 Tax=Lonepinella koalarum TaxID=53417 RepID=UPI0011E4B6FA|nr:N-acetylmuramoyl-L-alanine amidase [Lonepinella koalarum]TYG34180.1 N-acetylmuramoyl-L-alanine amidase [Lonepinella koalarum]